MSKEQKKEQQIDWNDINAAEVRIAMFFDSFMKMSEGQQSMVLKILNHIKSFPKPQENKCVTST